MLLYVQISLQQYHCLLMVNVFPLISAIVLGDFLFYVTAVNKMFNLGAGGDVLCYRVARSRGDDGFPCRLVLGRSYQCWGEQLGLESNHCLSPLVNLTWLHLIFFIATMIIFLLILREATQSSLSAALLEPSVHLDFLKQIVSAWLN